MTGEQVITIEPDPESPSGKGAADENFPVASLMIAPRLRRHVTTFYEFARAADDIADNPALTSEEKVARLDRMEAGLTGHGPARAIKLRISLKETGVSDCHARDLLSAFRHDAIRSRYADWRQLAAYCKLSADPVGRYLIDLHGEDTALCAPSDALCTVLQVLNHLQDCQQDFRELDRVYLPLDMLADQGLAPDVLGQQRAPAGLRRVFDQILDRCDGLLAHARKRPVRPRSRRLSAQMAVITRLAERLSARLRRGDPLAGRVALTRTDFMLSALGGAPTLILPGRP